MAAITVLSFDALCWKLGSFCIKRFFSRLGAFPDSPEAVQKSEALRVKREGEKGKMLNVILLDFMFIPIFDLIIVIFIV